jgi:hypothetical protein
MKNKGYSCSSNYVLIKSIREGETIFNWVLFQFYHFIMSIFLFWTERKTSGRFKNVSVSGILTYT